MFKIGLRLSLELRAVCVSLHYRQEEEVIPLTANI